MKKKINQVEEFHKFVNKVSLDFDKYILNEINNREDSKILNKLYKKFFKLKMGVPHQRVGLVFIAAKIFGIDIKKNYNDLIKISAVPELLIWSEYAFNWVTDGKNNDSETKFEDNINLITSQYLLTEVINFIPERMLKKYLELYRWGIFGCLTVETDLRITNWKNMKEEKTFWRAYSRNHIIPDVGALYAYCFEIVKDYFQIEVDPKTMKKIIKIGLEFGRIIQINGDLSDFIIPNSNVHTTEKRAKKDYFIDIRTDRLTYPSWLLLKKTEIDNIKLHNEIINSAKERKYENGFYEKVYEYIKEKGIAKEVLDFMNHEEKRLLRNVKSLKIKNNGTDLLRYSIIAFGKNKFKRQIKIDYLLCK